MEYNKDLKIATCKICLKTFKGQGSKQVAKIHLAVHTGEKSFKCDLCDTYFPRISNLAQHIQFHEDSFKLHPCLVCKKSFTLPSQLRRHAFIHSGEKPYECEFCKRRFNDLGSMKRHKKLHNLIEEEKGSQFKCEFCSRRYPISSILKAHALTHTSEKPISCDSCNKKFKEERNLKRHLREIHSDERKYKCDMCPLRYYRNSVLQDHKRLHRDEKRYNCEACPLKFAHLASLRYHEKASH